MSYTTSDFEESIGRVAIQAADVAAVEMAWGMGTEGGNYRHSDDAGTEWSGGFLMRLSAGGYVYLTGWCDYTGWGCQDGAEVYSFAERPTVEQMRAASENHGEPDASEWDTEPADLNNWLARSRDETPAGTGADS